MGIFTKEFAKTTNFQEREYFLNLAKTLFFTVISRKIV